MIFAIVLFTIAVWEHYKGKNVPASWLVGSGVFFFAFGFYQAWSKERNEKEVALARLNSPDFDFQLGAMIWQFDEASNRTLFFPLGRILNKGHKSITMNWSATYRIGQAREKMTSFYIRAPFTLHINGEELVVGNGDLLNVKTIEAAIDRGCTANGRLLWTLPGNRENQLRSMQFSIEVICQDYESREYKALYLPSSEPLVGLVTHAHETARKAIMPAVG